MKENNNIFKSMLVFRLILVLIITGLLQASAATYGQQITIANSRIKLKKIFKIIKVQTGYTVLWNPSLLSGNEIISANFINTDINHVLKSCLSGRNLGYVIDDNTIVVKSNYSYIGEESVKQDSVIFKGKVFDEKGQPLAGATIRLNSSTKTTFTNKSGDFSVYGAKRETITISFVGYRKQEITLMGLDNLQMIRVKMIPGYNDLGEVNIVSTGYQELPRERATGSFEVITKEQLQHSTDPNLLRRLEGITTSMNFNNQLIPNNSSNRIERKSLLTNLTIRGKNTLTSNAPDNISGQVLVVIDGVASPYPTPGSPYLLDMLNPNDVESVTILKDAAAASIWGSRAANGVIVIKTKKGGYDRRSNISFNSNFNVAEKLDLFYKKYMSSSEYIDAERLQFNSLYNPSNPSAFIPDPILGGVPQPLVSPVFEILNRQKRGQITNEEANSQINSLRGNDIRRDYSNYFLRKALRQSYSLAFDGGSKNFGYRLSANYDNSVNNTKGSAGNRVNLAYNISVTPLKNLEFRGGIAYARSKTTDQAGVNVVTANSLVFYPYSRLADDQGNPLTVSKNYRDAFINLLESTYGSKILNMRYTPLSDIEEGYYKTTTDNFNISLSTQYKPSSIFSIDVNYNFNKGVNNIKQLYRQNSYYMRELINTLTDPSTLTRNLPLGGIYSTQSNEPESQTLRGQVNVNKNWSNKHVLSAIAGTDISQTYSLTNSSNYLAYDEKTLATTSSLNFVTAFPRLFPDANGRSTRTLPAAPIAFSNYKVRTIGVFTNIAYTYFNTYTISGSIRKDGSSQFGKGINKGGSPFWSLGTSWNIGNEKFYNFDDLPILRLRATYGYNGNVNPAVVASPLLVNGGVDGTTNLPYLITRTGTAGNDASNSELRPEKSGIFNVGIDFGIKNDRFSGSIEYYNKRTTDLLNSAPVDPSTGFSKLIFNTASLRGNGWDLNLRSANIHHGLFRWDSNFLFSYNRVKVTKVFDATVQNVSRFLSGIPYNVGFDLSRLFAFRWAGLDPVTGDPRGYLNDQIVSLSSSSATSIMSLMINAPASSSTIKYMGSSVPVYYGSLRNTFSYGLFSLSANILYKFGYYFRRTDAVNFSDLFDNNTRTLQGAEYNQRWQQPGDENRTNVPSLTFPTNPDRDLTFYSLSEINVLKGDHVRLQELNLSFSFNKKGLFIKNPKLYANVSNLGIIWRANKIGIDPDTQDYPTPRTYSLGISANF